MDADEMQQQDLDHSLSNVIEQTPMDQRDDLEVFRIVFEIFDQAKSGYIQKDDFLKICQGYIN